MDEQDQRDRLRQRALLVATVMVGLGLAATVTGWHREAAVPVLVIGLVYAVVVLVMDRRRPRS